MAQNVLVPTDATRVSEESGLLTASAKGTDSSSDTSTLDQVPDALPFPSSSSVAWGTSNTPIPGAGTSTRVPLVLTEPGGSVASTQTVTPLTVVITTPLTTIVAPASPAVEASSMQIVYRTSFIPIPTYASSKPTTSSPIQNITAPADNNSNNVSHEGIVAGVSIGSALALVSLLLAFLWRFQKTRRRRRQAAIERVPVGLDAGMLASNSYEDPDKGSPQWDYVLSDSRAPNETSSTYTGLARNASRTTLHPSDSISVVMEKRRAPVASPHPFPRGLPIEARHPALHEESNTTVGLDGERSRDSSHFEQPSGTLDQLGPPNQLMPLPLFHRGEIATIQRPRSAPAASSVYTAPERSVPAASSVYTTLEKSVPAASSVYTALERSVPAASSVYTAPGITPSVASGRAQTLRRLEGRIRYSTDASGIAQRTLFVDNLPWLFPAGDNRRSRSRSIPAEARTRSESPHRASDTRRSPVNLQREPDAETLSSGDGTILIGFDGQHPNVAGARSDPQRSLVSDLVRQLREG